MSILRDRRLSEFLLATYLIIVGLVILADLSFK